MDRDGSNWAYLPYGPFATLEAYEAWLSEAALTPDPNFFAIIKRADNKAVGLASYLRINPQDGSIEVGHINYSPLLQKTREGTEAMYLMMKWAFESGYRRYEWKCNALNTKSRYAAQRLGLSYEGCFGKCRSARDAIAIPLGLRPLIKNGQRSRPVLKPIFRTIISPLTGGLKRRSLG
jgi:RimJ/RimL family protein N-acetyltransferase